MRRGSTRDVVKGDDQKQQNYQPISQADDDTKSNNGSLLSGQVAGHTVNVGSNVEGEQGGQSRLQQLHQHLEHLRQEQYNHSTTTNQEGKGAKKQQKKKPEPRWHKQQREQAMRQPLQDVVERQHKQKSPQKRQKQAVADVQQQDPSRLKHHQKQLQRLREEHQFEEQKQAVASLVQQDPARLKHLQKDLQRLREEHQFQEFLKWKNQQEETKLNRELEEENKRIQSTLNDQRKQQQNLYETVQQQQDQIQQLVTQSLNKHHDPDLQAQVKRQEYQILQMNELMTEQENKRKQQQDTKPAEQENLYEQVQQQQDQIQQLVSQSLNNHHDPDLQAQVKRQEYQILQMKELMMEQENKRKQQQDTKPAEQENNNLQAQIERQEYQILQLTKIIEGSGMIDQIKLQEDLQSQFKRQEYQLLQLNQNQQEQQALVKSSNEQKDPKEQEDDSDQDEPEDVGQLKLLVEQLQTRIKVLESDNRRHFALVIDRPSFDSAMTTSNHINLHDSQSKIFHSVASDLSAAQPAANNKAAATRDSDKRWQHLHKAYNETFALDFIKKHRLVFMHPEEVKHGRSYNDEELSRVLIRPFPSRLFITNVNAEWNTVWLRTRHTDHHAHRSSFIQVRDVLKADAITRNPPAAKSALTSLLNMCYNMEESHYNSFACTLASAFSQQGYTTIFNTEFEKDLLFHKEREAAIEEVRTELQMQFRNLSEHELEAKLLQRQQARARARLLILMDIVFSKLRQKKLLVDEKKYNIYRLVNCMTKYNKDRGPYVYALFSFFFQVCAAVYVVLSLTPLDEDPIYEPEVTLQNLPLAICTAGFGLMAALPEMKGTSKMHKVHYGSLNSLAIMDFVVNFVLPILLAVAGFFVVLRGTTFIDGVLNAVALIFITEIDDQLPHVLEMDTLDIVQSYLIDQAMDEYEYQNLDGKVKPIQFTDILCTNTEESGSNASKGVTFQPYEVFGGKKGSSWKDPGGPRSNQIVLDNNKKKNNRKKKKKVGSSRKRVKCGRLRKIEGGDGIQVANKRSVSKDCLLRKISWQYTWVEGLESTSRPRIGHLKLEKLVGDDASDIVIDIFGKQKAPDQLNKPWYSVTGVYIITNFSMSDDVLSLRICGSHGADAPKNFLLALDYYSLWPMDSEAVRSLKKAEINPSEEEIDESEKVLRGMKPCGNSEEEEEENDVGEQTLEHFLEEP